MTPRRKVTGVCHICGENGPLSFEHVPPRAAFNDRPMLRVAFEKVIGHGPDERVTGGQIQQRGAGAYTLCGRCNNLTGKRYASRFVEWCHRGVEILSRADRDAISAQFSDIYPLAIIKQIAVMFFSLNDARFREVNQELVAFVQNRDAKDLNPHYRFHVYFNFEGRPRFSPVSGVLNFETHSTTILSELAFPPFGYVLTFGQAPPDPRLLDISHLAKYGYDERTSLTITLSVLPTHMAFPGDYRSREAIYREAAINARPARDA